MFEINSVIENVFIDLTCFKLILEIKNPLIYSDIIFTSIMYVTKIPFKRNSIITLSQRNTNFGPPPPLVRTCLGLVSNLAIIFLYHDNLPKKEIRK